MRLQLGEKAKHKITGFTGIIIARTEWLNGCWRMTLQSHKLKDGIPVEPQTFDEFDLELVEDKKVKAGSKETGGPRPSIGRAVDPQ